MRGRVVVSLPVDATDEADARTAVIDLLARALARKCVTQRECREWIARHGEIRFEPDPSPPDPEAS